MAKSKERYRHPSQGTLNVPKDTAGSILCKFKVKGTVVSFNNLLLLLLYSYTEWVPLTAI